MPLNAKRTQLLHLGCERARGKKYNGEGTGESKKHKSWKLLAIKKSQGRVQKCRSRPHCTYSISYGKIINEMGFI
jgi:hypothetical protein